MEELLEESLVRTKAIVRDASTHEARAQAPTARLFAHRLFETWSDSVPQRVAVRCGHEQLTYAELNTRTNQLARYLEVAGGGRESRVGICLHRTAQMVVAILAVLKAGAAYVPLDPTYPAERLSFILNDAQPKLLITQRDLIVLPSNARTIDLDREWPLIAKQSDGEPDVLITKNDPAHVISPSASMDQPKGVMITHGNLGHYAQSLSQSVVMNESDAY